MSIILPQTATDEERRVSASLLVQAITASPTPDAPGFEIDGATVSGPIDLRAANVGLELCFRRCTFTGPVLFRGVTFEHRVRFVECTFDALTFDTCRTRELWLVDDLNLAGRPAGHRGARVHGAFSLVNTFVGGDLACDGVECGSAVFNGLVVEGSLLMRAAIFNGAVDAATLKVRYGLYADSAEFRHTTEAAQFTQAAIEHECSFASATFCGPADFTAFRAAAATFDRARFTGTQTGISFNSARIGGTLSLAEARIEGAADFSAMRVGYVNGSGATFAAADTDVRFESIHVEQHALFAGTTFNGGCEFDYAEIHGVLNLSNATFVNASRNASFHALDVHKNAFLQSAAFSGPVKMASARVGADLRCDGARFLNGSAALDAASITVGGHLVLRDAEFHGPADFRVIQVSGRLIADRLKSMTPEAFLTWEGATVSGGLDFTEAAFQGEVDFVGLRASAHAAFSKARFGRRVTFNSARVASWALFHDAEFEGPAEFWHMEIGSNLELDRAGFADRAELTFCRIGRDLICDRARFKALGLSRMSVGGCAYFQGVTVDGPFNMSHAHVAMSLVIGRWFDEATSTYRPSLVEGKAIFSHLRVQDEAAFGADSDDHEPAVSFASSVTFDHAVFTGWTRLVGVHVKGTASFSKATFLNRLLLLRVTFDDGSYDAASFAEAEFHGQVMMKHTTVMGRLSFYGARASHNLRIGTSCQFHDRVDFEGATLSAIVIDGDRPVPSDLSFLGTLLVDGCRYQRIVCPPELGLHAFWNQLLASLDRGGAVPADFRRQPFLQFEEMCRATGEHDLADAAYVQLRKREGARDPRRAYKLWNRLERSVFGYGVNPVLMMWWFVALWVGGAALLAFPSAHGVDDFPRALGVSLGNLVPGTGDYVEKWRAVPETSRTVTVAVLQHLAGWMLIGLLAERFFKGLKR